MPKAAFDNTSSERARKARVEALERVAKKEEKNPSKLKYFLNPFRGCRNYSRDCEDPEVDIEYNSLTDVSIIGAHFIEIVGGTAVLYELGKLIF